MTRSRTLVLGLGAAALLSGGLAAADEPPATAKEVAELRREVRELRAALRLMISLDRERVDLLTRLLGEGPPPAEPRLSARAPEGPESAPAAGPPQAAGTAAPAPEVPDKGTVSGTLALPPSGVAWVYVENAGSRLARGRTIEIKQLHHQFEPRWAVVQQGTEIRFPNLDGTYHNVFASSPNATFDLGIYRLGDPPKSYVFSQPGVTDVFCNMHSEMSATVLVVPGPHFTQVAPDGSFTLAGVPGGRRKLVAWTPHAEPVAKWVVVEPGKAITVSLALAAPEERAHLDKSGKPYGSYK